MALISRNPNEAAYVGGKKHWADVIKNSGSGELLIWRQPEEDFNTNSTLIVMPGEEAIFINGGVIEEEFKNEGTYKLSTENYPFISRLRNNFTGGVSTFNCVVYFVRKADSKEILWGTDMPIQVRDKAWNVRTDAKVRGAYKVRIENPSLFLKKLIGNNVYFQTQEEITKYFQNELQSKIRTAVSKFLNQLQQELIGIDEYLDELSERIEPYIDDVLKEYGLKCVKFSLSGLDIDITKYDRADDYHLTEVIRPLKQKAGKELLGEDYRIIKGVDLLTDVANNPGAGGIAAAGAGMGLGMAAGSAFGSIATSIFGQQIQQLQPNSQPSQPTPSGRFAPKGSNTIQADSKDEPNDPFESLSKLKELLEAGLIEQSDYDAAKTEILSRLK